MVYGDFKDLRTAFEKILLYRAFDIATNPKNVGYQLGLASMVYRFFYEINSGANSSGSAVSSKIISNQKVAEELNKPIIRKLKTQKVYSSFMENGYGANLVVPILPLITKLDKIIRFSLCVIDTFKVNTHRLLQERYYNY